jgi:hypothetical protein
VLDALESRIAAVIGEALADRAHLTVVPALTPVPGLAPGEGAIRVAVAGVAPRPGFARDASRLAHGPPPTGRRVLPLEVAVRVSFQLRPPPGDVAAGRALLLADYSALGHALGDPQVQNGAAFRPAAPDPGFFVLSFSLDSGEIATEADADMLTAHWHYRAGVQLWPVGAAEEEGLIDAVDVLVAALPLRLTAVRQHLRTSEQTEVRISGVKPDRLVEADTHIRAPTILAVRVMSDLPPDQRGQVLGGDDGAETGLRLISTVNGAAVFTYAAPAGDLRTVTAETVAVHVATPEGHRGVFLGGVTVGLLPGVGP